MQKKILIITNQKKSGWLETVKQAAAFLGQNEIISADDIAKKTTGVLYDLIIIDTAASKETVMIISDLHARNPNVPILVATFTRGWRRTREAMRAGARDYILKSLTKEELTLTIKGVLGYPPKESLPLGREDSSTSKGTILFADNDPDFLATRKEFLEQAGYAVIQAINAVEAERKLNIGGFDLAILDIRLEDDDDDRDVSGLVLAKTVARNIPKIILTNFPTFEYVRETLRPQLDGLPAAVDIISKTEGVIALLNTIDDILRTAEIQSRGIARLSKVFIVHGHDTEALEQTREFLQSFKVKPIILFEQADRGDTIIEKLERCCREADFAIVLFTRDDFGYSRQNPTEVKHRARQNVIFELGYMVAKLGRRRVRVLYQQNVEIPTDFMGVLYIEMDEAGKWRPYLERELKDTATIGKENP